MNVDSTINRAEGGGRIAELEAAYQSVLNLQEIDSQIETKSRRTHSID